MKDFCVNSSNVGHCYELAIKYIMHQQGGTLVHARVWSHKLNCMIGHALVEIEMGWIYEPVTEQYLPKDWLYEKYKVQELKRYDTNKVMVMTIKHGNFGPWEC